MEASLECDNYTKDDSHGVPRSSISHRMDAWLSHGLGASQTRSVLRHLLAIEVGDKRFNADALLPEERLHKLRETLKIPEGEGCAFRPKGQKYCDCFDLEWALWMMSGTCLTFLLFNQETRDSMPETHAYVANLWGWYSEKFWRLHAHGFYGTECNHHVDDGELLHLTVRFLTDAESLEASQRASLQTKPRGDWFQHGNHRAPMHFAAKFDLDKVASVMLEDPAIEVNAVDCKGKTPLEVAAFTSEKRIVPILLGHHSTKNDIPCVPYRVWPEEERGIIQKHLQNPALPRGLTALHLAAMFNFGHATASLLQDPGTDVHARDGLGRTPLFYAGAGYGEPPGRKGLCQFLVRPDVGCAEIDHAVACDASPLRDQIEMRLEQMDYMSASAVVPTQLTPLHIATILRRHDALEMLVQNPQVDIEAKDSQGHSPGVYAVGQRDIKALDILLAAPGVKEQYLDRIQVSPCSDHPECMRDRKAEAEERPEDAGEGPKGGDGLSQAGNSTSREVGVGNRNNGGLEESLERVTWNLKL